MAQFQRNKYKVILRQDFLDYINRTFWITEKAGYIRVGYEFAFLYLEPDYFMLFLDLKACCQFILDFKKNIIF